MTLIEIQKLLTGMISGILKIDFNSGNSHASKSLEVKHDLTVQIMLYEGDQAWIIFLDVPAEKFNNACQVIYGDQLNNDAYTLEFANTIAGNLTRSFEENTRISLPYVLKTSSGLSLSTLNHDDFHTLPLQSPQLGMQLIICSYEIIPF